MCGSMLDIESATAENRRGRKRRKKEEETTAAKYNGLPHWAAISPIYTIQPVAKPVVKHV